MNATNIVVLQKQVTEVVSTASGDFASTLTQYQWGLLPETQLRAAEQALSKNEYLMKIAVADPKAVHTALVNSAVLGLDLTEGKRQGWLLPRKNQLGKTVITLQVGYKGVEAIHQELGVIDRLVIRVVRENDVFEWSGDDQEKPSHKADWMSSDDVRGKIIGAFAITYYPDKSITVISIGINEIYTKHRDRSDSWKKYLIKVEKKEFAHIPPWQSDEKAMVEKTMAFIASKQWPANNRDGDRSSKMLETLHQVDMADYQDRYTVEEKLHFDSFFEFDDSLGLYLFGKRIDIEHYSALFGSFKKGEKTKMKDLARVMVQTGFERSENITEGLTSGDDMLVKENVDGCQEITMKMLKATFSERQKLDFEELLNRK